MNNLIVLKSNITIANKHSNRLERALLQLNPVLPLTLEGLNNLSPEYMDQIEILINRFARLQDFVGGKIFPLILELIEENLQYLAMIDILNLLEKRGFLDSFQIWTDMRAVRNKIIHDYPDESQKMFETIVAILEQTRILLDYWQGLKEKMDHRIFISLENNSLYTQSR